MLRQNTESRPSRLVIAGTTLAILGITACGSQKEAVAYPAPVAPPTTVEARPACPPEMQLVKIVGSVTFNHAEIVQISHGETPKDILQLKANLDAKKLMPDLSRTVLSNTIDLGEKIVEASEADRLVREVIGMPSSPDGLSDYITDDTLAADEVRVDVAILGDCLLQQKYSSLEHNAQQA